MSQVIIAVIVTGVIVAAITWVVANQHRQKTYEAVSYTHLYPGKVFCIDSEAAHCLSEGRT